jgi:hypothetical protein
MVENVILFYLWALYLKLIYLDQPANSKQSGTVFNVPFSKAIPDIHRDVDLRPMRLRPQKFKFFL